jgi:hypothetical protein
LGFVLSKMKTKLDNKYVYMNPVGGQRWAMASESGSNGDVHCPVCRQTLHLEDIESHLIKEFTELQQL